MVQINPTNPSDSTNVANPRLNAGSLPPMVNESKADSVFSQAGCNRSVYVEGNDAKYSGKVYLGATEYTGGTVEYSGKVAYCHEIALPDDEQPELQNPLPKEPESKPGLLQRVMNFFFGD